MSSTAILERAVDSLPASNATHPSSDWEAPAGPADAGVRPRTARPGFIYLGYSEEHWRGQACHLLDAASLEEWAVVFSCGCQASVPSWTLERTAIS